MPAIIDSNRIPVSCIACLYAVKLGQCVWCITWNNRPSENVWIDLTDTIPMSWMREINKWSLYHIRPVKERITIFVPSMYTQIP